MSSPVLTVAELTVSGLTMMASPVIADANKVGFSSVALATPVLADDELVTDKWLAMLEQRAKEKWWL